MMILRRPAPSRDFDDDREWIDVTTVHDSWDVELDVRGDMSKESSYRHRPLSMMGLTAAWRPGRPPNGPYRTNIWKTDFYPNHPRLGDPVDGDIVIYGRNGSGAGCGDPSFSIWMIPGTGRESD
jgi:hypothetical protein